MEGKPMLHQEIDWRVTPFVAVAVIVAIFALAWTAGAEEVRGVIYRGPAGTYVPQAGELIQQFEDGRLLVTRTNGEQAVIDLSAKLPAAGASGQYEIRYKPNGEPYRVLVQSQATKTDVALAEHDLRVMQDDRAFQLKSAEVAQEIRNDQHDNKVDWSEEARDWKRNYDRAKDNERRAEERAKRDKQRRRENLRRDAQRTGENMADRAQDSVRRGIDRLERWSSR